MSELNAGFLVPGVILAFLIGTFFLFRFLTMQANSRRKDIIDSALTRYIELTESEEHLAAANEIIFVLKKLKPGALSYSEQAPLFLSTAEALHKAGQLPACLACTAVIEHLLPVNVSIESMSPDNPRLEILENTRILQKQCSDQMLAGYLSGIRLRVKDVWMNDPNLIYKAVAVEIKD